MSVFALLTILTLCTHCNLMHVLIGMQHTGATSHMTSHRHWLHNYVPKHIPIELADNKTVYSAGEGIVYFNSIIDGKAARTFAFTRVLHVPDLRNNLLSVLFLTRHGTSSILASTMIRI